MQAQCKTTLPKGIPMFKTLKSIWQGLTQKGKIFPYQLAFTLLIPLSNWALSPQQIAQLLHFVPHHRICCGVGYFSCVGWASAHRFFIFAIGRLKPTLRLIRLLIHFPLHPNHAAHRKKRAHDAATASNIGRNETKRQYADTDTSSSACLFFISYSILSVRYDGMPSEGCLCLHLRNFRFL